jgi:hypothetical protein
MRQIYLLTVLTIILSIVSAYFSGIIVDDDIEITKDQMAQFDGYLSRFIKTTKSESNFDLYGVYSNPEQNVLLNRKILKNSKSQVFSSDKSCFKKLPSSYNVLVYEKAYLWEEFRCGVREKLDFSFFVRAPYMHFSGSSYAFLALKTHKFSKKSIIKLLPYFNIQELGSVQKYLKILPSPFKYLHSDEILNNIRNNEEFFIYSDKVFYLSKGFLNFFGKKYHVYSLKGFQEHLKSTVFRVAESKIGIKCVNNDKNYCLNFSVTHLIKSVDKNKIYLFLISLLSTLIVFYFLMQRFKEQNLEDEKKNLAIRILSHEFRTPVASMMLTMENVKSNIMDFDPDMQAEIFRLSSDVHRLYRLTMTSKNYLSTKNKLIDFNPISVPLNEHIECFLEQNKYEIKFEALATELEAQIDVYWFNVCLKNLVENSLNHGVAPYKISIKVDDDCIGICVQDSGSINLKLSDLVKDFYKGNKSEGTGLGLGIVKKIIKSMGGDLLLENNPTTFILKIKRKV